MSNKLGPKPEDYCEHGRICLFCNECFRPIMDRFMQYKLEEARRIDELLKSVLKDKK